MINRIQNLIVIALIGFIGADRINFGAGITDSFKITPFLVLSFIFVLFTIVFSPKKFSFNWLIENSFVSFLLFIFLFFVSISVFFSADVGMSIKRYILLLIIVFSIILILSTYSTNELNSIMIRSSILGSMLFIIFDILLISSWIGSINFNVPQININPNTIGHFIPRPGGFSLDVNRGGVVLAIFSYIIFLNKSKTRYGNYILLINSLLLSITLSRSVYIFIFFLISTHFILFYSNRKLIKSVFFGTGIIIIMGLLSIYLDNLGVIELSPVLDERFSIPELNKSTSTGLHLILIRDGINYIFSNVKYFFLGIGHGASFLITTGYYWSGTKYGNFHSQLVTIFVENGVFTFFMFTIFTVIYPLIIGIKNFFLPLILALFFYNIFYQLSSEPIYWFTILLFYKNSTKLNLEIHVS